MKALGSFFGVAAPIVTIIATLLRLRWHRVKTAPGPTPEQTGAQKFLRVAAGVWLILIGVCLFIGVIILAIIPIVKMSN